MDKAMRGGPLVASFPVEMDDQIMLATSTGQSIRVPGGGDLVPLALGAGGVKVFNTGRRRASSRSPGSPIRDARARWAPRISPSPRSCMPNPTPAVCPRTPHRVAPAEPATA
jgi:hypothetical protein